MKLSICVPNAYLPNLTHTYLPHTTKTDLILKYLMMIFAPYVSSLPYLPIHIHMKMNLRH